MTETPHKLVFGRWLLLAVFSLMAINSASCFPTQNCLFMHIYFTDSEGNGVGVDRYTLTIVIAGDELVQHYDVWDSEHIYRIGVYHVDFSSGGIVFDEDWAEGPKVLELTLDSEYWHGHAIIRPDYDEATAESCASAVEYFVLTPKSP